MSPAYVDRLRSATRRLNYSQALVMAARNWVGPEANPVVRRAGLWFTLGSVAVIYFQIYWHYWLVQLLGGYVINTLLPITILLGIASVFLINTHVFGERTIREEREGSSFLWVALATYTIWAVCSVLLNEKSADSIQAYLIYVLSPPVLFVALVRVYGTLDATALEKTLRILFFLAIGFSIYVASTYLDQSYSTLADMSDIETNRGTVQGDSGASYGLSEIDLYVKRFTIPGISSTSYGPMLAPMILTGWYLFRHAPKRRRFGYFAAIFFLSFCMVMTISRGPILALTVGMLYATWWGWMRLKAGLLIVTMVTAAFATFGIGTFIRIYSTVAAFVPLDSIFPALTWVGVSTDAAELVEGDPHLKSVDYSLTFMQNFPAFGVGRTEFAEYGIYEAGTGNEHNNYLAIGGSFGIPALLAYLLFIGTLLVIVHRTIMRLGNHPQQRDLGIAIGAGLVALMAYIVAAPSEFHFIWVWFGLAAGWVAQVRSAQVPLEA